jgi:hypothetical protein
MNTMTATAVITQLADLSDLNVHTDCDKCGAGILAATFVILASGGLLSLCQHHTNEFFP